jgi:SEC-C motif
MSVPRTSSHPARPATRRRSTARGVRRLTGPVHAYILDHDEPRRYEGFTTFNAGDPSTEEAVREVHRTAERLHAGTTTMIQTPVVVEDSSGGFIGYCSIHRRQPFGYPDGPRPFIAERYIVAFGRDLKYRKCPLRDNTTYVGEIVVRAGLDMIALEAVGKPMPSVSALVRPENGGSHRVLETYGFVCTPTSFTGFSQDVLWREAGEPLPPAPGLDVYVPPFSAGMVSRNDPCPCGSGKKFKKCCER